MGKIEKATVWMESHARDNRHGYDQRYRWGEKGDFDCSGAVITAWESSGVPVKSRGASYTGNMLEVFLKCGFKDVTKSVNLRTGAGLKRGDVLLKKGHHVAMYCGNGREVEASINEKGKAVGGRPGDQTGREFLIRSYRNYPWSNVLRYVGEDSDDKAAGKLVYISGGSVGKASGGDTEIVLKKGSRGDAVKAMQRMLAACGYGCGSSGADGVFGKDTYKALVCFQMEHGLVSDGEYGRMSEAALLKAYRNRRDDVDRAARDVLAGKYGNGEARKKRLRQAGYDPVEVQKRVNELLRQ